MSVLRTPAPLESAVEAAFLRHMKKLKLPVRTRKMNGLGFRDWPDRLVIGPNKMSTWIEFKRPVFGRVSPGQEDLFKELMRMGHDVSIFTDGIEAAEYVKEWLIKGKKL